MTATTDLSDDHPDEVAIADVGLHLFGGVRSFHGMAATVACLEDNVLVHEALAAPGEGRVLVVDGGGSLRTALFGDKLAAVALDHGWVGVVVHGAIRDAAALAEMPIGVAALAAHPRRSAKRGEGSVDVPVSFLGVTVRPGDWVYVDADGLAVAPRPLHLDD